MEKQRPELSVGLSVGLSVQPAGPLSVGLRVGLSVQPARPLCVGLSETGRLLIVSGHLLIVSGLKTGNDLGVLLEGSEEVPGFDELVGVGDFLRRCVVSPDLHGEGNASKQSAEELLDFGGFVGILLRDGLHLDGGGGGCTDKDSLEHLGLRKLINYKFGQ